MRRKAIAPTLAPAAFAVGDGVVVINGDAKGRAGRVVARAHDFAPDIPAWSVELDCVRVIREDFLGRVNRDA